MTVGEFIIDHIAYCLTEGNIRATDNNIVLYLSNDMTVNTLADLMKVYKKEG